MPPPLIVFVLSLLFCGWCLVCGWISLIVPGRTEGCDSNSRHKDSRAKGHDPVYLVSGCCETLDVQPRYLNCLFTLWFLTLKPFVSLHFPRGDHDVNAADAFTDTSLCMVCIFSSTQVHTLCLSLTMIVAPASSVFWVGRWRCVFSVSDAAHSFCRLFCFQGNNNPFTLQRSWDKGNWPY